MALDRTWYNSLVDDDGSGMTGSVWDKADVDALMDAVDAEIARIDAKHPWCFASLANSNGQSIPNATWTELTFDTSQVDGSGSLYLVSNAIRIVYAGIYSIIAGTIWQTNTAGYRALRCVNKFAGTDVTPQQNIYPAYAGHYPYHDVAWLHSSSGDEYVSVMVYHDAGGPLRAGGFSGPGGFGAQMTSNLRIVRLR